MPYNHTQIGYLMIFSLVGVALLFGSILIQVDQQPIIAAFMIFILLLVASFATLNVTINQSHLRIKFGYGIFKKSFKLEDIAEAKAVRNHWYYGWGIRGWFWPRMLIFNVSGFDAVQIKMNNGKIFRIGTDEPEKIRVCYYTGNWGSECRFLVVVED